MAGIFTNTKNDMQYLFAKKDGLTKKERRRKRRAWGTVIGLILVLIQFVLTVLVLKNAITLDILPLRYMLAITLFLVFVLLFDFITQFSKSKLMGKILAIALSGLMLYSYIFSAKVVDTLSKISGVTTRTDVFDVVVLADDKAESIADTANYTYGYCNMIDADIYESAMGKLEEEDKITPETKIYSDWDTVVSSLEKNNDIQVALISEDSLISLQENYVNFSSEIKILGRVEVVSEIELEKSKKVDADDPFVVYLSGDDAFGRAEYTGRSDVNIIAVINPDTKQVLLVTTPRDSFVTITTDDGRSGLDKLTHASNAGLDNSIIALENIYEGLHIDYYLRINFTGCIDVVDALGGIDVDSSVEFTNGDDAWFEHFHYNEGINHLNGEQTLAFVRERHAFAREDFQRGENQEAAIKGIINKATSKAILTKYDEVLDAASDMILTNMPTSFITDLVKGQLSDGKGWNVQSYAVTGVPSEEGKGVTGEVYNIKNMSVVYLDDYSIAMANDLMTKTMNGDVFNVDEYAEEHINDYK